VHIPGASGADEVAGVDAEQHVPVGAARLVRADGVLRVREEGHDGRSRPRIVFVFSK
jgi:hypothetical protein